MLMNIVAHNLLAMNAQRMFGINARGKAKSTEKLSSGYKINRAADDAAGLAISEKMRRQIRGLRQGTDNIQDGISLVQVAEGALNEITECLQRINELSIKAYNGTNDKTDREYIQSEVTQLITEIERIADTTTFNEIQVLKGDPKHRIQKDGNKMYEGYVVQDYMTEIPDWLAVSKTLEQSNSAALAGLTQEMGVNAVFQKSPGVYEYYGPQNAEYDNLGYTYMGEWTSALTDNASASIDFSGLSNNVTSAEELYQNLFQLIGTSIGVPCGTCTEYYGISFTGSEQGLIVEDGITYYSNGAKASDTYLDLSEWKAYPDEGKSIFDKAMELMKEHAGNDVKSDAEKEAEAKNLAAEIAEKLCDESFKRMSKTMIETGHFDKVVKTNDNKLVIYDYRDVGSLVGVNRADSLVQTSSSVKARIPYTFFADGEYVEVEEPIIIQCSSMAEDELPIHLPLIDAETMGIEVYDISFYDEKTVYSKDYQVKLEDWQKNGCHYELVQKTIPATPETTKIDKVPYYDFNEDGEYGFAGWKEVPRIIPATPERIVEEQVLVEDMPRPEPRPGDVYSEYAYNPDNVKTIADALAYVSSCRSDLGATQNRLEHAYNNNQNKWENTSASESRIRDTDMAKELVKYYNINILEQVGHAMMAQANQSNQSVLNLLQ